MDYGLDIHVKGMSRLWSMVQPFSFRMGISMISSAHLIIEF